jgi:hypothetical protein
LTLRWRGGFESDIAHELAVEEGFEAEIQVGLQSGNGCA